MAFPPDVVTQIRCWETRRTSFFIFLFLAEGTVEDQTTVAQTSLRVAVSLSALQTMHGSVISEGFAT